MSGGWNTIESDAGVFTSLIESLGVKDIQFEELLTLDSEELLALQPVYGVIFLFKYPTDQPYAAADRPIDGEFDYGASSRLFFATQTIQNACATQALLSVLLNKTGDDDDDDSKTNTNTDTDNKVDIGTNLAGFRDFAMALPPEIRGEALSNSDLIRSVHNSFARSSPFIDDTARRAFDDDDDDDDDPTRPREDAFHFIAYTAVGGTLYELDGLQPAPIAHGPCGGGTQPPHDFSHRVVDVLRRRVARYAHSEIRFNLLAMCRDLRVRAARTGDKELLAREQRKRREWRFENALRRHNFLAFAGQVLKGVAGHRIRARGGGDSDGDGDGDDAIETWVAESLERTKAAEKAMRRGVGDADGDAEMS